MIRREDIPKKLNLLPVARADLNRRIHELQVDDADTIEQLVGVTSRIIPGELPGGGRDLSANLANILADLDNRNNRVLALLDRYMQEDNDLRDLQVAVDLLPVSQRQLIKMKYFETMSLREIEDETGISKSTIQRKLESTLDTLYSLLSSVRVQESETRRISQ